MGIEFIEEGHYRDGQIEYFSIWSYKRKFNIQPNNNSTNYVNAKKWYVHVESGYQSIKAIGLNLVGIMNFNICLIFIEIYN
jgi:hypothetical protein